ncbi:MAG: 3-oxoadipate enol-lactonase, partial [Alphaproteobacteria bacterium]|nr:3-oxoadipate enol-lactonase [Alphaproteobacteria bacterium]
GMEGVADVSMGRWFTPEFRRREPSIVERFRQMVLETNIDGYIGCASSLKQRMLKPLLKTIEAPTHVIVGAENPSTPISHSEILYREIPNTELNIIPDAAHISNAAQPEAFSKALRTFLDRNSP